MRYSTMPGLVLATSLVIALAGCPQDEEVEDCTDGIDNDGDGDVDCEDSECATDPACEEAVEDCDNGLDDDDDGLVDCEDSDCEGDPLCDTGEICDNATDDDGDALVDCDDSDCEEDPACEGEICDNQTDDDNDGFADCDDPDCVDNTACIPEICDNEVDDDGDLDVDCEDPECEDAPECEFYQPWDAYFGYETFRYGVGYDGPGEVDCLVHWDVSGVRAANPCPDCLFSFDLFYNYNPEQSADDGSYSVCPYLQQDETYTWGYTEDYAGSGSAIIQRIYDPDVGAYVWELWSPASFDGTYLRYAEGYVDYYYAGTYGYYPEYAGTWLTNVYSGQGVLQ